MVGTAAGKRRQAGAGERPGDDGFRMIETAGTKVTFAERLKAHVAIARLDHSI